MHAYKQSDPRTHIHLEAKIPPLTFPLMESKGMINLIATEPRDTGPEHTQVNS